MGREAVRFEGSDTSRSPSAGIWGNIPVLGILEGVVDGVFFHDDFLSIPKTPPTTEGNFGQYAAFTDTGGTMNAGTGQGGELVIGSDGDNEGASLRTRVTPFKIARTTKRFAFEARVKSSTITDTKHGFFLGLLEDVALTATVPIAADGTLADKNFVGFHRLEADGDQIDTVYKADGVTQVSLQTDALPTALVADTYTKLGMLYEPLGDRDGSYRLTFWQNGVRLTTSYQIASADGTDFPNDIGLGLVFAVLNATGTTPGTGTLDWWRAAQILEV